MKKIGYIVLVCILVLSSCKETTDKKEAINSEPEGAMAKSSGRFNHLTIVMENDLWEGEVGEAVRKHLAAPVDGLPQEEPLFTMRQMPNVAFSGFARKNRTFIQIKKEQPTEAFTILKNKFATPQVGIVIQEKTNHKIIAVLEKHLETITEAFKKVEIAEKQQVISKSLEKIPALADKLKVQLKISSAYRVAKETENFFWIRKDIPQGSLNLMVYELPKYTIAKDTNIVAQLIKMRDSIGAKEILTDDGGVFVTEEAYAPYLFDATIDDHYAYEMRGTWEVKNKFMAGPFVNYAIEDKANNRLLVLEGFVFAPSISKRDYIFELEAMIKSAKLL